MAIAVFVFTDIEGSTLLWANSATAMESALARHDEIITDALQSAGGSVFKHTGDGVCAVFSSARNAMTGAAAAQHRVTATDWGELGALKVRMAVHAGEATARGSDWFGPALNRTARLMAIVHGGQVVASSAAVDLCRDALPPSVGLKDLGVHRLRDLAEPEHVWQLMGDGLMSDFAPLVSLDRFRGNLPIVPTSFHGRDAELDELTSRLLEQRLVTLVGPGGVGKTRLALQTGAAIVDKFRDGTWFIELARLSDGAALDHAVSTTLRITPRRGVTERETVLEAVHDWHALLIVDNCEHLIDVASEFVAELMATAPSVVVLATSREPLHLAGEVVWLVEPLAVDPSAGQLFLERAAAARPGFASDDETVAAVCRRLDGIPLALELAAARMRSMTTSELLSRLDRRFRLLGSPASRVVEGRHASLQATVDWSFDLLGDESRRFFASLSVFPSWFDLAAAHAVWGQAEDDDFATLDLLDTLVDKSLVVAREQRGETRYRLLETMRQYGDDRLSPDERNEGRLRHARHFAEFAARAREGVRGSDDVAWVGRVDESLDSIRAAMEFACERPDADLALRLVAGLEPYNQPRRNSEIWAWAEAALALPDAEQHPLAVIACEVLAFGGHARDNPSATEQWARRAQELHSTLNLPPDPRIGLMLTYGLAYLGRIEDAATAERDAIRIADAIGPTADVDRVEGLYQSAFTRMQQGVNDTVAAEELVAQAQRLGNVYQLMRAKTALGLTVAASDPSRGRVLLAEALQLADLADPPYWTGSTRVFAASIQSDPADALRSLAASLDAYRASGTRQWIRRSLREFLGPFGALGCYETVALIDGCSSPISTRPADGLTAIHAARAHLGAARYDEVKARGGRVSDTELDVVIRAEIAAFFERSATVL